MNRRGHLSTKIPQVKLRPAPAPTHGAAGSSRSKRKEREASPMNMMDEEILRGLMADAEDEESSTAALRKNSRPWKGVVITFTGVENKPYLTGLAKELGASVESALTIQVTHVVASGFGSAKYLYAVEHRLPVMMPAWIEEAHAQWLHGDELDNERDQEAYKLPPFSGLKIAMSSIEPLDRRKQLIKYITACGGQYSKDLDRSCTHLISAKPTSEPRSSEKVKWALREIADLEARKRRGVRTDEEEMKIVYEEWVWDCVAFGGRWKEDHYDARKARRGARVKAEDVLNGTLKFDSPADSKATVEQAGEANAIDTEPAVMRKRKREDLNSLVGELISTAGVKTEPEAAKETKAISPQPNDIGAKSATGKPSLLHFSRTTSFATSSGPSNALPQTSERTASLPPTAPQAPPQLDEAADGDVDVPAGPARFFAGLKFSHVIAEQCDALEGALTLHGGQLVSDEKRRQGERVDFIIVRLCSDVRPVLSYRDEGTKVVTECWVEGCCFEEKLLSPDKHIVFRPLPGAMPVPGAARLIVHLSGFSAENTVYMRRLLRALGGTLSVKLNRQTTHLVSVLNTGQKPDKAREWGVQVMRESWLVAMARSGVLEPEEGHRHPVVGAATIPALIASSRRTADLTSNMSTVSELPESADFARRPQPSSSHRPTSQLQVNVSPSRMLKPSPTHVGEGSTSSLGASRTMIIPEHEHDSGDGDGDARPRSHALSPPKAETERLLNSATTKPFAADFSKENDKISRHVSAPANAESLTTTTANPGGASGSGPAVERAASMSVLPESLGGKMTEALRQLASTPGGKGRLVRRTRPSARIKSTNTRSPMHSVSPAGSRFSDLSPVKPGDPSHPTGTEAGAGYEQSPIPDDVSIDMQMQGVGEESVQVKYVDAASARERRKIMAMLNGEKEGKKARTSK